MQEGIQGYQRREESVSSREEAETGAETSRSLGWFLLRRFVLTVASDLTGFEEGTAVRIEKDHASSFGIERYLERGYEASG